MKIKTEIFEIPGARKGGLNPLPAFRNKKHNVNVFDESCPDFLKKDSGYMLKVLPYLMQDRYTRQKETLKLKSVVLENEYLVARFLPEYGGRLHSLYDKVNKKDLLFTNTVIQPGNLAIRNAWLSGGIEWNVGNFGHHYLTCDNVYSAILDDGEGNQFLRIYEFERNKSVFWQIDFHLPENSRHLISYVKIINPFDRDITTYYWANVAVPSQCNTRVLASNKMVMSFSDDRTCRYERLPNLKVNPYSDATYPKNARNAYDYFIQKDRDGESTWEAAAYDDGLVFYERSTAPLYYKKLFCWGNHVAGTHWQEFLSAGEGTGYYAEIQAGIAPSQLHDKLLPKKSAYEWLQCFGGVKLDAQRLHDENYDDAVAYFDSNLNAIMPKEKIEELAHKYAELANKKVEPEMLYHTASGFGALEVMRMRKDGDGTPPQSMYFPKESIGDAESAWLHLLQNGYLKEQSPRIIPQSYMISPKWIDRIASSTEIQGGKNWLSLLHLGIAVYEYHNTEVTIEYSYDENKEREAIERARLLWLESVSLVPNVWAYRNLAVLEEKEGNVELTEEYYDKAIALEGAFDDYALASEYLMFLQRHKKYQKLWELYLTFPDTCKSVDRIRITAAVTAVKLGEMDYLEEFFKQKHHDIREGETTLTDVWFEYCALKFARERGITDLTNEVLDKLIDEAWDSCPPDKEIDFRMSSDKKYRYRV